MRHSPPSGDLCDKQRQHSPTRRGLLAAAGAAACFGPSTVLAQNYDQSALIAAAKKEGIVTLYGVPTEANVKQASDAFGALYGIGLEFTRLTNNPMRQRIEAEFRAGRPEVDVFIGNDRALIGELGRAGQLLKLDGLPSAADYPPAYRDAYGPGLRATLSTLMYNTKLVGPDTLPRTWEDLLQPRWKGRIGLTTPEAGPAAIAVYALVRDRLGDAYFEKLGRQEPQVVGTAAAGASLLTSGEIAILVPSYNYIVQPLKESGAPIDGALLDLTIRNVDYIAGVEKARHRNAALLFLDWSLSPEGQKAWAGNGVAGAARPGIPTTLDIPDASIVPDPAHIAEAVGPVRQLFSRYIGL